MALSPAIEAGRTGQPPEFPLMPRMGRKPDTSWPLPDGTQNFVIIPTAISREQFQGLDGITQETILISLIKKGVVDKVSELRADFEMNRPLEYDEIRVANWTYEITRREEPITLPRHETDDGLFSMIHHSAYSISGAELANLLERERQRRVEFAPGLFAPAENIGRFTAARRYRAILEAQIAIEEVQRVARKKAA